MPTNTETLPMTDTGALIAPTAPPRSSLAGTMVTPPVVQTSNTARTVTTSNLTQLDQIKQQLADINTKALDLKAKADKMAADKAAAAKSTATDSAITSAAGTGSGTTINEATARSLFGRDFTGVTSNADGTFTADQSAMDRIKQAQQQPISDATLGVQNTMTELNNLKLRMDAHSSALIDAITNQYNTLIQQQEQANAAYEGGTTTEGIVSGRARYAPILQGGIITAAISSGIQKISDLQAKKNSLIIDAQNAADEKNFKLLQEKMSAYKDTVKEERIAAQNMYENSIKASTEARQQAKDQFTQMQKEAELIAPTVSGLLTGDEATDSELIQQIARDRGIDDPQFIIKAVQDYEYKKQQDSQKGLPTMVNEYEYAKNNGFFDGSYLEYVKLRGDLSRATPKSKVLNIKDAMYIGVPSLAGVSEDELIMSIADDYPPEWFRVMVVGQSTKDKAMSPYVSEEEVQKLWKEFQKKPEVKRYTTGYAPSTNDWFNEADTSLSLPQPVE